MSLYTKSFPILLCPNRMKTGAACKKYFTFKHCCKCGGPIRASEYSAGDFGKPLLCVDCEAKNGGAQ